MLSHFCIGILGTCLQQFLGFIVTYESLPGYMVPDSVFNTDSDIHHAWFCRRQITDHSVFREIYSLFLFLCRLKWQSRCLC
ncbi:hypothetical protein O6H91_Y113400 [Diphasiastrum complanatum]|nr:hypothetical protein O6H91_Y113400 [Diphasiastrum complanatum]